MIHTLRVAIARLFSDLIKADSIIDSGEMECWKLIRQKYDITKDIEIDAQQITFATALTTIRNSGMNGLREDLMGDCRAMARSDGFCAHSEALIMTALMLMLETETKQEIELYSIPRAQFNIDKATVLYVESYYDEYVNSEIEHNYRAIFKELQLTGFHFVYMPSVIKHYRTTDPELFRNILSFLAPSLSEEGIDTSYRSLLKMDTATFCKDLLCNKCGIGELRDTKPAIIVKIGNSFVAEDSYANYLKIDISQGPLTTVQSFVDKFCKLISSDLCVVNTSEEKGSQFHFHGFYKQLLDIFLIRRNIRSTIVIDPAKEEIVFPDIDVKASGLHRREKTLYALMLCQGAEGLNFTQPKDAADYSQYCQRMDLIQRCYRTIYTMFGGTSESAPDLSLPEIRRPIFSCLKRSIRELPALYNPNDYNISKNRDGVFSINIEPELIYVRESSSAELRPLAESELYKRWMKAHR